MQEAAGVCGEDSRVPGLVQQQLASEADGGAVMQDLAQCLSRPDALKDLSDSTKDLHSAVNKLGKVWVTSTR